MEHEFPFKATAPAQQRAAIEAYLEGEQLCDRGDCVLGAKRLREACRIAWELSSEEWPSWALVLRAELLGEPLPATSSAPLLSDLATALNWQPELSTASTSAAGIAAALRTRSVAVIDSLIDDIALLARARDECRRASESGVLQPARVATVADGPTGEASPATRSDRIAWVGSQPQEDDAWPAVGALAARLDALVRDVRTAAQDVLGAVQGRERVMVAAYGQGDAFAKHSDNHCVRGVGAHCTARVLSAVIYLSPADWVPGASDGADGGSLRLYRPAAAAAEHHRERPTRPSDEDDLDDDVLVEVAPLCGRVVLFLSDLRCPHEVLPVLRPARERFSMITWYTSGDRDVSI